MLPHGWGWGSTKFHLSYLYIEMLHNLNKTVWEYKEMIMHRQILSPIDIFLIEIT